MKFVPLLLSNRYILYMKTTIILLFMVTSCSRVDRVAKVVLSSDGTTLTFYYDTKSYNNSYAIVSSFSSPKWTHNSSITTVVFDASFADARPVETSGWFSCLSSLTTIKGLEYLNTSEVTNMNGMFEGCSSLTTLDLSSFNTEKVTNQLSMFPYCSSLTSIDLSSFNTAGVDDMSYMFEGCSSLISLDLSSFNTENVEYMSKMFAGCSNLSTLDLSSFKTEKVDAMRGMFEGCSSLTFLDLSSFNTEKATNMENMFYGCSSMKTIFVSNGFTTDSCIISYNMFGNCTSLVGGSGTSWDEKDNVDATYARLDGGPEKPGYFSTNQQTAIPALLNGGNVKSSRR